MKITECKTSCESSKDKVMLFHETRQQVRTEDILNIQCNDLTLIRSVFLMHSIFVWGNFPFYGIWMDGGISF